MNVVETMIDIPVEHEKNVCGQFDQYLKKIERTLRVTIVARDGAIKIIGPEGMIQKAKSVFNNLVELSRNYGTKCRLRPVFVIYRIRPRYFRD